MYPLCIERMWYQVVESTIQIGIRVASGFVSKLDSESKKLNFWLRGGMSEVISRVWDGRDQVKFEGELNIDEPCIWKTLLEN